ncbi:cysteine--tRNA ligase [Candidatus Riesia pediculicola]|uniref:Cysteine--tRNA ligase n=1 Tax=Riesia pediculicola (strain USDA) TaxID=515618 RepID=D4G895_RIEPU|nr:cysteine--tRNA ligase [Candidatus Riesia pediculicola]ADD79865.1 cysteinyl-tRNA synthetase [Candidatus Riesia pediculicola USDA]ARC53791.1 cysteine--tRNA ligase [Candidatus Riesia pediculicola]QOJ86427.1 cysteine--tRNA ligase [Candidatus Riesia pediculicola]
MLKIYNTIHRKKEKFIPIVKGKVSMYVCGITAYDLCHIGHGRTFTIFDMITKYLRFMGYKVNHVRNITDIDDKIIQKAIQKKTDYEFLAQKMTEEMRKDFRNLKISQPNIEPNSTSYVQSTIDLIKILEKNGKTYRSLSGDILFNTKENPEYGNLSKRNEILNLERKFGRNIKNLQSKKCLSDFILWKSAKEGEPFWNSPWGKGRPGWHTECAAMSTKILGKNFDIHGGGSDLIFPHHENERIQSIVAYGDNFANYWIHTGMLKIQEKKMSKSDGNFFKIRDICSAYNSEVIRYFFLSSHYRHHLNYSINKINQSKRSLEKLYFSLIGTNPEHPIQKNDRYLEKFEKAFIEAMNDDFNTPKAYSILFKISKEINLQKKININIANRLAKILKKMANVLGLLNQSVHQFFKINRITLKEIKNQEIENIIQIREKARKNKNWEEADRIRKDLYQIGIILEDRINKTYWRIK